MNQDCEGTNSSAGGASVGQWVISGDMSSSGGPMSGGSSVSQGIQIAGG